MGDGNDGSDGKGDKGDKDKAEEPNLYLRTLQSCQNTLIPNASHAVYAGTGDPGSTIASAISGGGWVCTEADTWVTELTQHTSKVMPAFTDAGTDVSHAISAERATYGGKDTVPAHDPHGLAWTRTWHIQQHNL